MSLDFSAILSQRKQASPDKEAYRFLLDQDRFEVLTYAKLYDEVKVMLPSLKSLGNRQPIVLLFNPGLDFIKALYACLCSGHIAVPVAIPRPAQELAFQKILENSGAQLVLTDTDLKSRYSFLASDVRWLAVAEIVDETEPVEWIASDPEDIAILQYTSGSTGNPKGVMVSYANLMHNLAAIRDHFEIDETGVSFSWLPHYHDMGLMDGILQPLLSGCKALLSAPKRVIGNPKFWLDCISTYGVTHTGGPNFFYEVCTEKVAIDGNWDLSSLKDLYISAEPVRLPTLQRFAEKFEPYGFSMDRFTPGFGLAEGTLMISCKKAGLPVTARRFELSSYSIDAVSLGQPIPGIEIKIVHPETQQTCSQGEAGEIWLKGPSVTKGYWKNPEQTNETYEAKIGTDYYLRTGDLGIMESGGVLYVVGRIKDTVIQNGTNYQAEDIEYAISSSHEALRNDSCVAFSVESGIAEELVILIKIATKQKDSIGEMEYAVRKSLFEKFGLSKASINFHSGTSYAKTTSGKIRRSLNREMYLSGQFNIIFTSKL